jgi:hypothetical protein
MAVGLFTPVNNALLKIVDGTIDLDADTVVAVLVDVAHTAATTDDTYSDISTNECADPDYTAQVVAGMAVTEPVAGDIKVDANDVAFGNPVSIGAKYAYLLTRAGGSLVAGDLIIGYMDLNDTVSANVSSINSEFTVGWHATDGLFKVARSGG